ncbi:sugar ABC transporter ATP-binding protein [Allopusillimonas soli]|uniref:Sugar ABC transporter ATP-binding protein n=1 Tax=Allopusillimonas soli TaxID=659016 RepID=A0A853FHF1_9BURK|nr:sugar ABC transporter ATP-binding protein [Allopusillimonas soli]NYT38220.1 sugar ABC transporter ATP-binding protein [Allopusillimonas soli]TEA72201.1 sugar ABC transporter ATP-binding protein [Allopusillimonas soli]
MSLTIAFESVSKDFGPVRVLRDVSFSLPPGKVHGLLGENGAGKSTLMKILGGYERPTQGRVWVDGKPCDFASPREAEMLGIVLIHQEINLAEDLTIAENIFLGREHRRGLFLDAARMRTETAALLKRVGLNVDPDARVSQLIVAEKQLVEIAKALARDARLLIMDEPTATLTPTETDRLFGLISQMRGRGCSVIYISHKLDEVARITDDIVVMRDGAYVTSRPTASVSRREMANLMVGRELEDLFPSKAHAPENAEFALEVQGIEVPGWAHDVGFSVRPGEILGFAGLVGAGRTELFEGLLGLRRRTSGRIRIGGRETQIRNPRDAARQGLTYLSEDRKGKGIVLSFGMRQNLTLMALQRYTHPLLDAAAERRAMEQAIQAFGIRARDPEALASSLSGGNQQKLALAKVLHPGPGIVVLDEPTRGVDIGAKRDIYFLIHDLARQGLAVIVISSELVELIGLCHRVAVMRTGYLTAMLDAEQLNEKELIAHATGTHQSS